MTMMQKPGTGIAGVIAGLVLLGGCVDGEEADEIEAAAQPIQLVTIDPRRSLVVTEEVILERFSFARVMDQLVAQSGVSGLTSLALFHQWWDTQNPNPGVTDGPHCDDTLDDLGRSLLNGYPYACRPAPAEGAQAVVDPFTAPATNLDAYLPIGLFNRFDLAPTDGTNCGEYRVVFAKRSGIASPRSRNLIIFEANLANPHPQQGLKGCKKIVEFWADLSGIADVATRATKLEQFYFTGIPSVAPVIHVDHLGGAPLGVGQVRTNQFLQDLAQPRIWSLREFKLARSCTAAGCTALEFVPVTVKGNPFGPLFDPTSTRGEAAAFRAQLVTQVDALAAADVTGIDMKLDGIYNNAQSDASGSPENVYVAYFGSGPSQLRTAIDARLATIGSSLTATEIVARAQALSCAGCHRFNNNVPIGGLLTWPTSLGFTHVTERETEVVDGQRRFLISPALIQSFLPKRKQVLEDYLNERPMPQRGPKDPIGGRRVH